MRTRSRSLLVVLIPSWLALGIMVASASPRPPMPQSVCGSLTGFCVRISGPTEVALGQSATFSVVVYGTFPSDLPYSWSFGDGISAIGSGVSHAWTSPGEFVVNVSWTSSSLPAGNGYTELGITVGGLAVAAPSPAPPSAPTNVTATVLGPTSARLDWTRGSTNETGYGVWDGNASQIAAYAPAGSSYMLAGLPANSDFCVILYAYNSAGASGWSNWACFTTPP